VAKAAAMFRSLLGPGQTPATATPASVASVTDWGSFRETRRSPISRTRLALPERDVNCHPFVQQTPLLVRPLNR
jgi:hypothetical protein